MRKYQNAPPPAAARTTIAMTMGTTGLPPELDVDWPCTEAVTDGLEDTLADSDGLARATSGVGLGEGAAALVFGAVVLCCGAGAG